MKMNLRRWVALAAVAALVITSVAYNYSPQLKATDADGTYTSEQAQEEVVQEVVLDGPAEGDATEPVTEEPAASDENLSADASVEGEAAVEEPAEEEVVEEVKMPAQTLTAKASDGATITVTAAEGVLPEGASVKVTVIPAESVIDAIEAEAGEVEDLAAYDIVILDKDGNEIQPNGDVSVKIKNADIEASGDGEAAVYHVSDDKTSAELVEEVSNVENASFTAEHFSVYAVVKAAAPEEDAVYTITWNVDGVVTTSQVDAGNTPAYRGTPQRQLGNDCTFAGWVTQETYDRFEAGTINAPALMAAILQPLPAAEADASYHAVFTSDTYCYIRKGNTSQSSISSSDYVYAGLGRVVVPDGLDMQNSTWTWGGGSYGFVYERLYASGSFSLDNYVISYPGEVQRAVQKAQGLSYTGNYEVKWTTFTYGESSKDFNGRTHGDPNRLHMDGVIISNSAVVYEVEAPESMEPNEKVHEINDLIDLTVKPNNNRFTTDGFTYNETIEYNGDEYIFDGWYHDKAYTNKAATWTVRGDGVKTFYGRYVKIDQYNLRIVYECGEFDDQYNKYESTYRYAAGADYDTTGHPADPPEGYYFTVSVEGDNNAAVNNLVVSGSMPENDVTVTYMLHKEDIPAITDEVTIVPGSAFKVYDGDSLTKDDASPTTVTGLPGGYTYEVTTAADPITNVGESVVSVETFKILKDGKDVTEQFTNIDQSATGLLQITPRPVQMESASDEKAYDGTPLTNEAVTVAKTDNTGFVDGEGATYNVTGSQTDVGSSENTFTYTLNDGTNKNNYVIGTVFGTLTVTPLGTENEPIVVTIQENSGSGLYDGEAKTVTGYEVSISNPLYTEADFAFSGNATVTGTDAGSYPMELKPEDFENINNNFENVKFVVKDGTLEISKRNVTLTSATDSKEYDGKPLTNDEITVSGDGFTDGEGAEYDVTGSQTAAGSSDNTFTYTLKDGTKKDNYNITTVSGTLTVTDRTDKYEIEVVAKSGEFTYDGEEKSVSGFKTLEFEVEGQTYTVEGLTASAKGTDADAYTSEVTGTAIVRDKDGNDVSNQFTVTATDGELKINPRTITLKSADDEKVYDGKPLTNDEITVDGDGFADGEGATYAVTGSQTDKGSSTNTFTYMLKDGTKANNYVINTEFGTLTVYAIGEQEEDKDRIITITAASDEKKYDGEALINDGFEYTEGILAEGDVLQAVVEGSQTDAGESANQVTSYKVMRGETDVTANYTFADSVEGTLKVAPRNVMLTSADAEKVYDGTPLTNDEITVGGDGFVAGEGATYDVTGSQTDVGSSENTFDYMLNDGTKTGNYEIEKVFGTLEVIESVSEWTVTKTAELTTDVDGDGAADVGDTITYTVEVKNTGNVDLADLVVTDVLNGEAYDLGEDGTIASLPIGETATIEYEYVIQPDDTELSNAVTVTGPEDPDDPDDPPVVVETPVENWSVVKTVYRDGEALTDADKVNVGDVLTYEIVVTNTGTADLEGLIVKDVLNGDTEQTFQVGDLAAGKDWSTTYEYTVASEDDIVSNVAVAAEGDEPDVPPTDPDDPDNPPVDSDDPKEDETNNEVATYLLTINYVDTEGNPVAQAYTDELKMGAVYDVESPTVEGYTPDYGRLMGAMPGEDLTLTVVYSLIAVPVVIDTPDGPVPTPVPVVPPVVPPVAVVVDGPGAADLVVVEDAETALANIQDGETPLAAMDHWALLNLILTIFTALMSIVLLALYFKRKKDDEEAEAARMEGKEDTRKVGRRGVPRILSAVWAVLMIIVFILTEDMTLPMEFTDEWTWLMVCMTIMQLCIAVFCKKVYEDDRKEPDAVV